MGKTNRKLTRWTLLAVWLLTTVVQAADRTDTLPSDTTRAWTIDLAGRWDFAMGDTPDYRDHIALPGSMLTGGKGDLVSLRTEWVGSLYDSSYYYNPYMKPYQEEGKMKLPFFLTPERHYVGTAWYGRTVHIPRSWSKRHVILHLERPHIETVVYINGQLAGRDSSLSVPHTFDITPYIVAGQGNRIDIRVYNGIEHVCVGQDSHSVTDQTQGDWNGIVGRIALEARPPRYVAGVQVYPNLGDSCVDIRLRLKGAKAKRDRLTFTLDGKCYRRTVQTDSAGWAHVRLPAPDSLRLWDEFTPYLYELTTVLGQDTVCTTFGMREISTSGRQFLVNGRPTWMRGTVENCCFPLTGYPPTDVESWERVFRQCRAYGLNMMRFHSFCPPEAAFVAADRVGFYLQPEGPSWPNHGVKLGRGMSIDHYLLEETERMVEAYGNHPSFCLLAAGNEPAGNWVEWVGQFVDHWKQTGDRRRLYCGASVGGGWAFDPRSEYHVKGGARGLDWDNAAPQSTDDFRAQITRFTQKGSKPITFDINEPFLSHEQGQWCAFPDFREIDQYTGVYKAGNLEIFRDLLRDGGMATQAEKFLMASGRLQTLCYKYEIERNLRTPEYAGFMLLALNDYSGQGTALVGVLNVFWREKGYCTAADWTRFCAPVVPLTRFPKFVYTQRETAVVPVVAYNAYARPLAEAVTTYTITDDKGREHSGGRLSERNIPLGQNTDLGTVSLPLQEFDRPTKLTLTVRIQSPSAPELRMENAWDFWVYPDNPVMPPADGIYIADTLDNRAREVLAAGGRVLLTAAGRVRMGSDVQQTYLPVFWNTSWFKMRPPHTTGVSIDTSHPLFREFPTDDWSNLNWWELINKAQVMNLRELPADYQPPIQPIDTWHLSRKLGMLIEARIGPGRLLMTTMDLATDLDHRPVARQMRRAVLAYMQSDDFDPNLQLDIQYIANLFEKDAPAVDMHTNASPDELKPALK